MGERSDNFLHAFDGWTLDWNSVFGLGFESAPDDWVSVFRECAMDELVRIAREGLTVPAPDMRHPEMRQEMELLDRYRPETFVEKGVSRLRAIYATPTPETPGLSFRKERAVLEMKIDPASGYVGDMDFISALIPFMSAHRFGMDKYHGAFRRYWESVIPLGDFNRHYEQVDTNDGPHWIRKSGSRRLPKSFFSPEIMVMSPIISKQHVRLVRWDSPQEQTGEWWEDPEEQWGEV